MMPGTDWTPWEAVSREMDTYTRSSYVERSLPKVPVDVDQMDGKIVLNSFQLGRWVRLSKDSLNDPNFDAVAEELVIEGAKQGNRLDQFCLGTGLTYSKRPNSLYDHVGIWDGSGLAAFHDVYKSLGRSQIDDVLNDFARDEGKTLAMVCHPAFRKIFPHPIQPEITLGCTKGCVDLKDDVPLMYLFHLEDLALGVWLGPESKIRQSDGLLAGTSVLKTRVRRGFAIKSKARVRCFRLV